MTMPPELLQVIATCNRRVVLVTGAGCSKEDPTGLPLADELAETCHEALVANGYLTPGDCPNPSDLSLLADAVADRDASLESLKEEFPPRRFEIATPNDGHWAAAALMREGAVAHIATLNFDLAQDTAISGLDGSDVAIVDGDKDFTKFGQSCLVYLHRSVRAPAADLVLRTKQLEEDWARTWLQAFAERAMGGPFTVFVGLGTPAAVLVESVARIAELVDGASSIFVVDPRPAEESPFLTAIQDRGIDATYVQAGWNEFVARLGERVAVEQRRRIRMASEDLVRNEPARYAGLDPESLPAMLGELDVVDAGKFRAAVLKGIHTAYRPFNDEDANLIADLLLAVARLASRLTDATVDLRADGMLQVLRDNTVVARIMLASGAGSAGWRTVDRLTADRLAAAKGLYPAPVVAIVGGVNGPRPTSTPRELVAEPVDGDLVHPKAELTLFETWQVLEEVDQVLAVLQP